VRRFAFALGVVLVSLSARAQTTTQRAADIASWGTVSTNAALQTLAALRGPSPSCAVKQEAVAVGVAVGVSELLKALIRKQRPDGSDFKSFPSEHTAIAFATSGYSVAFGYSLAIGTAAGRVTAKKHDGWDVSAGAAIGEGGQWLGRALFHCPAAPP